MFPLLFFLNLRKAPSNQIGPKPSPALLCVRVLCGWRKESRLTIPAPWLAGWLGWLTRGAPCTVSQSASPLRRPKIHFSPTLRFGRGCDATVRRVCLSVGGAAAQAYLAAACFIIQCARGVIKTLSLSLDCSMRRNERSPLYSKPKGVSSWPPS